VSPILKVTLAVDLCISNERFRSGIVIKFKHKRSELRGCDVDHLIASAIFGIV